MIISLILGVILGAVLVIFVLQNVVVVTVSFLTWQITGSLALVLLATIVSGVVITLLVLLPGLIKNDFSLAALKKRQKQLEDELGNARHALSGTQVQHTQTVTTVEKTPV
jgi:uncharacterized integral membrane protein